MMSRRFSDQIRSAVDASGLSRYRIAKEIGIGEATMSRFMTDKGGLSMASLDKLKARDDTLYWPGHGGAVHEPARFVRALQHHRRQLRLGRLEHRLRLGDVGVRHCPASEQMSRQLKRFSKDFDLN